MAFVSSTATNDDMANLGKGHNVRVADANNGISLVEAWTKIPAPAQGYYYFQNRYDFSYLTAPGSSSGGSVYTASYTGSTLQMWKINGPSYSAELSNLAAGEARRLTYHAPGTPGPSFTLDLDSSTTQGQNFNIKNVFV